MSDSKWRQEARAVIAAADATLPKDASISDRKKCLSDARPYHFRETSWGRKIWGQEARKYYEQHGQEPRKPLPLLIVESPMEKAKRLSDEYETKLKLSFGFSR